METRVLLERTASTSLTSKRGIAVLLIGLVVVSLAPAAQAADPTTADCLAASNTSIKLRADHKLRDARSQLLTCASVNCPTDVRAECARRVDDVNRLMPTIVFETKDAAGNDLSAVKVTMDGQLLVERLEGTAISLDPGEHRFTFEAAGQPPIQKALVIREGEKERRERIVFESGVEPKRSEPTVLPAAPSPKSGLGTQKTVAIVAAGVGVVGLGLGSLFGLQAMSKKNDAAAVCPETCTTQSGVDLWKDAASAGNLATVAFIVGAAGIAGGAVLWFTAPAGAESRATTQVGVAPGMIQVRGTW